MKHFTEILAIARENVRKNPGIVGVDTFDRYQRYSKGLINEIEEVTVEVKENNQIYLTDELSDIAWNYAVMLALLEERGLIDSVEAVLEHGLEKYKERSPAFLEADQALWDKVKTKQKAELKQRHEEKYGK